MRSSAEKNTLKRLREDQSTTHGLAAEASAAKTICLLRKIYSAIQTKNLENNAELTLIEDQRFLVRYLETLISLYEQPEDSTRQCEYDSINNSYLRLHESIVQTVALIQLIHQSPAYQSEEKKQVFSEMKFFAESCSVSNTWRPESETQYKNRLYIPETKQTIFIFATLAEVLNLISAAILDDTRYSIQSDNQKVARNFRIDSFFNTLLGFQVESRKKEHSKCNAGKQHDVLFLLNHTFLASPVSDVSATPIKLVEDIEAYLHQQLIMYFEYQVQQLNQEEQATLIFQWIQWQANVVTLEVPPPIAFLRRQFPVSDNHIPVDRDWRANLCRYLIKACEEIGVNSAHCKIPDFLSEDTIGAVSPPVGASTTIALLGRLLLLKEKELVSVNSDDTAKDSRQKHVDDLYRLRNLSLTYLRTLSGSDLTSARLWLQDYYRAEMAFEKITDQENKTYIFCDLSTDFVERYDALLELLIAFYTEMTKKKFLSKTFDAVLYQFLTCIERLSNQYEILSIGEIFKNRRQISALDWDVKSNKIKMLYFCNDVFLEKWLQRNRLSRANFSGSSASLFEVNSIFLYALRTPMTDWSPIFCQALIFSTSFFLARENKNDSIWDFLKRNYPGYFLNNLFFMASIKINESQLSREIVEDCFQFFSLYAKSTILYEDMVCELLIRQPLATYQKLMPLFTNKFLYLFVDSNQFVRLMLMAKINIITEYPALLAHFVSILPALINDGYQLSRVFNLSFECLTPLNRCAIWQTLLTQGLQHIFTTASDVAYCLALSNTQFTKNMRSDLFLNINTRWHQLISKDNDLFAMLELPVEVFSIEQSLTLLEIVKPDIARLIDSPGMLYRCFKLPLERFTAEMRDFYINSEGAFDTIANFSMLNPRIMQRWYNECLTKQQAVMLKDCLPMLPSSDHLTLFGHYTNTAQSTKNTEDNDKPLDNTF